jgi:hypothetical protein
MALREVFARFGIEVDDKKLVEADKAVSALSSKLMELGKAVLGGAVAKSLFDFAVSTAKIGDAINDNATRLGISTQSYQQLGYAAQLSASSSEELTTALLMLQDRAVDAAQGGEESAKAFRRLGVTVKDAHGNIKPVDGLLLDVADKIAAMKDPAKQTAAAVDAFGRQGRGLLPFLKEGRAGLSRLTAEAASLGGGFDDAAVSVSAEFNDSLDRARFVAVGLRGQLAVGLLPVLRYVIDSVTKAAAWFATAARQSAVFEAAVRVLSAGLAIAGAMAVRAFLPIVLPMIMIAALATLLVLIVDDLIVLFRGGKSVFGEAIDALFGVGSATKMVTALSEAWDVVVENVKAATAWVRKFIADVDAAIQQSLRLAGFDSAAIAKGTPEQQRATLRRQAIAAGQDIRLPGETPEQAASENARVRGEMSRDTRLGLAQSASINAPMNVSMVVNAGAADAGALVRDLEQRFNDMLERRNREAAQALTRESR